jgi:hypothetical protein
MHENRRLKRQISCEFDAEFKKALACESGSEGGLFNLLKNEGRKSRSTVPLGLKFIKK